MFFRGKEINPITLWGQYCEVKEDNGPFLPLTYCPNPSHNNTHSPAFQINIVRPTVHCFSYCGISGSYEHAICLIEDIYPKYKVTEEDLLNFKKKPTLNEGMEIRASRSRVKKAYREARKLIYRKASSVGHISVSPRMGGTFTKVKSSKVTSVKPVNERDLVRFSYLPKEAIAYLEKRGIDASSRARWQIGFDEELERLVIPVRDHRSRLRFVIKRAIRDDQRPAYLYPEEAPKMLLLFGACNLDLPMVRSEGLVVVEGSIDTIRQHQHGHRNTVGVLGAYISPQQRELIARLQPKRIYAWFDKDAAGVRALERAARDLRQYQLKVPLYPKGPGLDPAKLSKAQSEKAIREAVPVLRVMAKMRKAKKGAIV